MMKRMVVMKIRSLTCWGSRLHVEPGLLRHTPLIICSPKHHHLQLLVHLTTHHHHHHLHQIIVIVQLKSYSMKCEVGPTRPVNAVGSWWSLLCKRLSRTVSHCESEQTRRKHMNPNWSGIRSQSVSESVLTSKGFSLYAGQSGECWPTDCWHHHTSTCPSNGKQPNSSQPSTQPDSVCWTELDWVWTCRMELSRLSPWTWRTFLTWV